MTGMIHNAVTIDEMTGDILFDVPEWTIYVFIVTVLLLCIIKDRSGGAVKKHKE